MHISTSSYCFRNLIISSFLFCRISFFSFIILAWFRYFFISSASLFKVSCFLLILSYCKIASCIRTFFSVSTISFSVFSFTASFWSSVSSCNNCLHSCNFFWRLWSCVFNSVSLFSSSRYLFSSVLTRSALLPDCICSFISSYFAFSAVFSFRWLSTCPYESKSWSRSSASFSRRFLSSRSTCAPSASFLQAFSNRLPCPMISFSISDILSLSGISCPDTSFHFLLSSVSFPFSHTGYSVLAISSFISCRFCSSLTYNCTACFFNSSCIL